jgi:hypothetical protein
MIWELHNMVVGVQEQLINIVNRLTGAEEKIVALETENALIKNELCLKDNSYSWCKIGGKE